jgi:pyrroloquinoline quinone biosynthesis protein D
MTEELSVYAQEKPILNTKFILRWEGTQDAHVLLYPEGVIKLNSSAAEILKRCTGEVTVLEMVDELKTVFADDSGEIEQGIYRFLEASYGRGWIRNSHA